MGDKTSIEWTDATWNPVGGCSRVSEGCRNCYAEAVAARFSGSGQAYEGLAKRTAQGPRWTGEVRLIQERLDRPLRWKRPRRIFVNSMSDLFHEGLSDCGIWQVFNVMRKAHWHTFQILTKRAGRMAKWFEFIKRTVEAGHIEPWPLPNVWLGVSAENQETLDNRWPWLRQVPAAIRFISLEPLLGPVDAGEALTRSNYNCDQGTDGDPTPVHRCWPTADWIIVGGESGPSARPFYLNWAVSVMNQCRSEGVACFVKQLGARPIKQRNQCAGPTFEPLVLRDRKGGDWNEWPEGLRVREMPEVNV